MILAAAIAVIATAQPVPVREPAWLATTWEAIKRHETAEGTRMRGDGGRAVGWGHITPILVKDVNDIARRRGLAVRWTLADRRSEHESWLMFQFYCQHYKAKDQQDAAVLWNCGPDRGPSWRARRYWAGVRKHLR